MSPLNGDLGEVLVEEAEGLFGGCGGEPDDEGVEVIEDLSPLVVDAAVALVDDDEVEGANGDAGVVGDGDGLLLKRLPFSLAVSDLPLLSKCKASRIKRLLQRIAVFLDIVSIPIFSHERADVSKNNH